MEMDLAWLQQAVIDGVNEVFIVFRNGAGKSGVEDRCYGFHEEIEVCLPTRFANIHATLVCHNPHDVPLNCFQVPRLCKLCEMPFELIV